MTITDTIEEKRGGLTFSVALKTEQAIWLNELKMPMKATILKYFAASLITGVSFEKTLVMYSGIESMRMQKITPIDIPNTIATPKERRILSFSFAPQYCEISAAEPDEIPK